MCHFTQVLLLSHFFRQSVLLLCALNVCFLILYCGVLKLMIISLITINVKIILCDESQMTLFIILVT